jgi:hypothetical protein
LLISRFQICRHSGFGIFSEVVATFSGKGLFSYRSMRANASFSLGWNSFAELADPVTSLLLLFWLMWYSTPRGCCGFLAARRIAVCSE